MSMSGQMIAKKPRVVSLRLKLLIGFTFLFSSISGVAFYWFYGFATEKTMDRLFTDMQDTALGTAEQIDVDELVALYQEGQANPNPDELPHDPRYKEQLTIFRRVHAVEPRAWPYTFVVVEDGQPPNPQRFDLSDQQAPYAVFLADLWVYYDASKAASFLETSSVSDYSLRAIREGVVVNRELYDDGRWGSWISTYVPLKDASGQPVAILGIDFEADYVREVQHAVRDRVLIAFGITYVSLLFFVYLLSGILTKRIVGLTKAATFIGEGDYEQNLIEFAKAPLEDEISTLARVFSIMVNKVREREESLKQQVLDLKIEVDETKLVKQVGDIVETDFFQDLKNEAMRMRGRHLAPLNPPLNSPDVQVDTADAVVNQPSE